MSEVAVKPAMSAAMVAPLRMIGVGALRVLSLGLAALADKIESEDKA